MLQTMVDHLTRCWMPDIRINVCSTYNTESSCVEVVSICGYYLYRGGYPATTNTPKLTLYESSPVPPSISGNRSQASLSTIGSSLSISGWNPISAQGSSFCNGMNECEAIFCSTCLASWSLFYFLLQHFHPCLVHENPVLDHRVHFWGRHPAHLELLFNRKKYWKRSSKTFTKFTLLKWRKNGRSDRQLQL